MCIVFVPFYCTCFECAFFQQSTLIVPTNTKNKHAIAQAKKHNISELHFVYKTIKRVIKQKQQPTMKNTRVCFNSNKSNYTARLLFGSTKQRKVAITIFLCERYREILFQTVASGYLLHFVQDGSSKNILEKQFLRKNINKTNNWGKCPIYSPLTPDQPPL